MACDAGERAPRRRAAGGSPGRETRAIDELRSTDPIDRLGLRLSSPTDPPLTDRRYVEYDAAHDIVVGRALPRRLVDALPAYFAVGLVGTAAGRTCSTGCACAPRRRCTRDLAHWTITERDGKHQLDRLDGRARCASCAARGTRSTSGSASSSPPASRTPTSTREHVYAPGAMKLPFSPSVFFRDITAMGGVDFRDLRGLALPRRRACPRPGFPIDGHMDARERAFAGRGDWFALDGHDQAHPGRRRP